MNNMLAKKDPNLSNASMAKVDKQEVDQFAGCWFGSLLKAKEKE